MRYKQIIAQAPLLTFVIASFVFFVEASAYICRPYAPTTRRTRRTTLGESSRTMLPRKQFLAYAAASSLAFTFNSQPAFAFSSSRSAPQASVSDVAYRALTLDFGPGVTVPVAVWHPIGNDDLLTETATYNHRISVAKIGDLLAGWDFIPSFASRNFVLKPSLASAKVYAAPRTNILPLPSSGPVVILAHGFLGSRFDLSHLAEELASEGFIVVSPEFPESLAASYPRTEGMDRAAITDKLLDTMQSDWLIQPTSYGIIGHSLGTGTVLKTGDDSWTRVCIAGKPSERASPALFIGSTNDGAVSLSRIGALPKEYIKIDENSLGTANSPLPSKAALIFDRPDAPNHISFLAEGPNDAMVQFLSPLLPVAQAMDIPVLDFDKYARVRDSRQTAEVVVPLVSSYLRQNMKMN